MALERTNQLAGCSREGLAGQVGTEGSAPLLALLTHRHDEGLSTGRGGTSGWKESWFYERSLKALGLFSLEKRRLGESWAINTSGSKQQEGSELFRLEDSAGRGADGYQLAVNMVTLREEQSPLAKGDL